MDKDKRKQDQIKKYKKKNYIDLYRDYYKFKKKDSSFAKDSLTIIRSVIDSKEFNQREEQILKCNYSSYPDYNEENFLYNLSRKAEFFHCKGLLNLIDLENKCSSRDFELGNHQQFLRNFINKNTPYRGVLVFHGVGVGKTCTAVTISNSFRDVYKKEDKKIICLVSKNIQPGWRNTIYDPTKGENQCSGDNFQHIVRDMDHRNIKGKVKKMIREYYDFYGYQQFSNKIKNLFELNFKTLNRDISEKEKVRIQKEIIRKHFSDRILIIDEIHNLRDDTVDKKTKTVNKETIYYLDKVIKYSKNLRLIIMSATPMFNKSTEIQWLLNLLLKNDNRPIINESNIFDIDGSLTEEGRVILHNKSKGYISYVRGENPVTFPIRLYPEDELSISDNYPMKDLWGNEYPSDIYQFKFLKMYFSQIEGFQKGIYNQYLNTLDVNIPITEQRVGAQILNVVYPTVNALNGEEEIDLQMYGKKSISNLLKISNKNKRRVVEYTKEYIEKIKIPVFHPKNIGIISKKIQTILKGLFENKSKGIIFIYTEFLSSGVYPLAIALEHMGFSKYSGDMLNYPKWSKDKKEGEITKDEPIDYNWDPISKKKKGVPFKQAKYIILSGDPELSPSNSEEIKKLVSNNNKNGENIKIVIGTVVASEGHDFKNIREIHILDPWYHLSRVEQIIGRGIRYCSHIGLEKEERNVTIFMHVAGESKEVESIDTWTYRKAEEKASSIGQVENILKENSIDCYLNKQINIINKNDIHPITLRTSRHKLLKNHEVHDKPYTKVCSFTECNYECKIKDIDEKDINFDTFSIHDSKNLFKNIQKIVSEMYEITNYYTLGNITEHVLKMIDTNVKMIYFAINDMVENEVIIWNHHHISGTLINKDEYYLFQPHYSIDPLIPLYYRNNLINYNHQEYIPLEDDIFKKVTKKVIHTYDTVYKKVLKLSKGLVGKRFDFDEYIPLFNEDLYFDISLDHLEYDEKVVLLKPIMKEYIQTGRHGDKVNEKIFEYFKGTLIYTDEKKNYFLFQKSKELKVIGFFLFNTQRNKEKSKKELDDLENDYDYFIFEGDSFSLTIELDEGELIKENLIRNLQKNKKGFLKTKDKWGYSYKIDKHVFKFVDNKNISGTHEIKKMPGRIIEQIAKKSNIRELISTYFENIYEVLINEEKNEGEKSKEFLYLLIELIVRDQEKNKSNNKTYSFIPYDLIFLKYIQ